MTNTTIIIKKLEEDAYKIDNVTVLSIGSKLIYVQYIDGEEACIRAFGRDEFTGIEIDHADGTVSGITLSDTVRFEARFPEAEREELPFC